MNRCVIIGGGEVSDYAYSKALLCSNDTIICADSGYYHAQVMQITPHLMLGDFDSYLEALPTDCEILYHNPQKDDTDTLLAVKIALERGYQQFLLLGMLGGRFDHTLANLQTLHYLANHHAHGIIEDALCTIYLVQNGVLEVEPAAGYSLSVFALDSVCIGVSLENLKYPLDRVDLCNDFALGVSNEFLQGKARITVEQGTLAVMKCRL